MLLMRTRRPWTLSPAVARSPIVKATGHSSLRAVFLDTIKVKRHFTIIRGSAASSSGLSGFSLVRGRDGLLPSQTNNIPTKHSSDECYKEGE